jgi:hypothetical protein
MPLPKSADAYREVEDYFDRALKAPKGIAVTVASPGQAVQLAQKLNHYRERLRKDSKKVYDPNHPAYGVSIYDKLQVKKDPDNDCRVIIRTYEITAVKVEEL